MNKAKLKSYAPQARKDFIAAVTARANLLGLSSKGGALEVAASQPQGDVTVIAGQAWPVKVHGQRQQLIARIQKDGFAQTLEAVAYTWFNRFAALRYMELHDYLGHGHRALSSTEGTLPDILTHAGDLAKNGSLPGLNVPQVLDMKLAGNRDGELYRMLLVAQCNSLSNVMPFLFERIDDETELLLPDNLLRTDSVIAKLVTAIEEEDWKEVEIIGWLYQFYISEKKDDVIGRVVNSEDIPAATQLFTPNWIVQYLVQNSVGRLWLMANPASTLKAQWPYYIEPAQQTPEVQAQLDALIQTRMDEDGGSLNPESITLLDPACGSGHILVEAYEVLKAIYLERGYQPRAIPRLILEKNLYGLDIDDRAAQMAGFALLMKARADDRRLFIGPIKLNVLALQESKGLDADVLTRALQTVTGRGSQQIEGIAAISDFGDGDLFPGTRPQISLGESITADTGRNPARPAIASLIATFDQAKTYGSMIQIPQALNAQLKVMEEGLHSALQNGDLYAKAAAQDLWPLVAQARVLGMQFDAVVANPPYMGTKGMNPDLKDFVRATFPDSKSDIFSVFMDRCQAFGNPASELAFVTPYVWMFIASYECIRKKLISETTLQTLIQLEYNAFEPACVPVCAFVVGKFHSTGYIGSYIKLSDFKGHENQAPRTLEAINNHDCGWFYNTRPDDFNKIPGSPVAYWVSDALIKSFNKTTVDDKSSFSGGMNKTADNAKYLRHWQEIDFSSFGMNNKWAPYFKGGKYRKYYGNQEWVIDWSSDALDFYKTNKTSNLLSKEYWYKKGITYTDITSSGFSCRYMPEGFVYDMAGPSFHPKIDEECEGLTAALNTSAISSLVQILNPTLHCQVRDMKSIPIEHYMNNKNSYDENGRKLINISKIDWNAYEESWDFLKNPLIGIDLNNSLNDIYHKWLVDIAHNVEETKQLEEENNRFFNETYGLQDEFSSNVSLEQITLTINTRYRYGGNSSDEDIAARFRLDTASELISYAIGCMMGRYSLHAPGLIYAHAGNVGFDANRYPTFPADADGILPLTDELWFEDDAASRIREFLLAIWGADTLAENMTWLAESLGTKASETPDETIRRYLADKFYKDHLQTYKKRPIYWLFSSGKQGAFQALVYLHRYHEGTLARLRAEYVVPLTSKIQSRIDLLQKDAAAPSSTAARNKLAKEVEKLKKKHVELLAYDEQLRHHADMRITLDLDDGVKVNYGKFGELLSDVKAVTGGAGDD